jgi:GH24 family phage-related lysozyme (muramidase)
MLNTATYFPKLKEFEGSIPFMYLDTTGNVTAGVGNMLPNVAAAQALKFQNGTNPAAAADIQADFDAVSAQTPGMAAGFYKRFTKLTLPEVEIDNLLNSRVTDFLTQLEAAFPDFAAYPEPACAAIFDMAYNLGLDKLKTEFPHCCMAIRGKNWATASAQCHRIGIPQSRNDWTAAQFQQAAGSARRRACCGRCLW